MLFEHAGQGEEKGIRLGELRGLAGAGNAARLG